MPTPPAAMRPAHRPLTAARTCLLVGACLLVGQLTTGLAMGQVSESQRNWLGEQLEAAKAELDPAQLPDVERSQEAFLQQVEATRQFFQQITTPNNAEAWMRYVSAQPLVEAIRSDAPLAEQSRLAESLTQRLSRNIDGLDLAGIIDLRRAADRLIAAIRFRDKERSIELLGRQLDALAERIRALKGVPSPDEAAAISAILGLLGQSGQAELAIQHVRQTFGQPNLTILVGESLISRAIGRPVLRTRPVNECILGTRVVGEATLNGYVNGYPIPSEGAVRIQLSLDANFQSNNTGYNGPVSLRTVGYGHVHASRTLVFDDFGPRLEPTYGTASLSTQILCIQHPLKLVRRIAAKKAAQQKPLSEQIAQAKLQRQVTSEFAAETAQQLNQPMDLPLDEVRETFARLGLSPPQRFWESTSDYVGVRIKQAEPTQISAASVPPQIGGDYAVVVQLHETIVNNVGSEVLAGRTMNEAEIQELLGEIRPGSREAAANGAPGETTGAGPDGAAEEPFEIEFARLRPVILEARDQTVRLGVRGTRFQQGDRRLQRAMEITAQYRPVTDAQGNVYLERTGEVGVNFPGDGRLSISQVAIKSNIQGAFEPIFPERILDRPLELPLDQVGTMTLRPATILAADAWLSVALRQES